MLPLNTAQNGLLSSLPTMVVAAIFIGIAGMLGWRYWKKRKLAQAFKGVPSPPRHWLLGNIPQILAAVKKKQLFKLLFEWSQQYGPIYVYWTGYPVLILSQPAAIESTIINGMKDGSLIRSQRTNRAWNDISGPILLGQSGEEWQWRRKVWNPEFSPSSLSKYVDIVDQACAQITEKIRAVAPSDVVQVDALFVELTMRVTTCLLLGIPVESKSATPEGPPLDVEKVYEATSVITYRFMRMATGEKRWMKYLPTKPSREYWAARKSLEAFLVPRIDLALRLRDKQPINSPSLSPLFKESMLVRIAEKEPKYTREALISEAIELLIAGTDTTAHTLSFAVGELALHPDVFQKAQTIVDQVWQQNEDFSAKHLKDLTYIRAIVKETLRLHSISSGSTSLQVVRPMMIEGIKMPVGTRVFWSTLAAGRDADVYAQPEKFWPERWLSEDQGSPSLPMINFGSGYHRCLGEHLAMLEATIMLTQLIRNFTWELANGQSSLDNSRQNLLIHPEDGMPIRFQLRATASDKKVASPIA